MVYCFYSDLALSVCRSTDLESKPEGRQARKQRKMVEIQARLIVPLPPVVMSLEQTVSSMCMAQTLCFDMSRSSGSLEATRAQLTDFDLPLSGLTENVGRVCEEKHSELRLVR
ncbi:unnamed protein product, partial [Musa acuminata var. zebrina]